MKNITKIKMITLFIGALFLAQSMATIAMDQQHNVDSQQKIEQYQLFVQGCKTREEAALKEEARVLALSTEQALAEIENPGTLAILEAHNRLTDNTDNGRLEHRSYRLGRLLVEAAATNNFRAAKILLQNDPHTGRMCAHVAITHPLIGPAAREEEYGPEAVSIASKKGHADMGTFLLWKTCNQPCSTYGGISLTSQKLVDNSLDTDDHKALTTCRTHNEKLDQSMTITELLEECGLPRADIIPIIQAYSGRDLPYPFPDFS